MDLYILNPSGTRTAIIDDYESLIWTERWQDVGDFELKLSFPGHEREHLVRDRMLMIPRSNRAMIIESVDISREDDGQQMMYLKGRSLERILMDRVFKRNFEGIDSDNNVLYIGTPPAFARYLFDSVCRHPSTTDPNDVIIGLASGTITPPGNIPDPPIRLHANRLSILFERLRDVCVQYDMGFRLVRTLTSSSLYFEVYMGSDLTTSQATRPPVVFDPSMENFNNFTEFSSSDNHKNVAYIFSNSYARKVYPEGYDPNNPSYNFNRRVMLLTANDPESSQQSNPEETLDRIAREELVKHPKVSIFDAEVDPNGPYIYGVDYNVGDLVEFVHPVTNERLPKRVIEQIFVSDQEGFRTYPTIYSEEDD